MRQATATGILSLLLALAAVAPGIAEVPEPPFVASVGLKRLQIGQQVGILKVLARDRLGVAYSRGIDDYHLARLDETGRAAILAAMGVPPGRVAPVMHDIISNYSAMPRKEAVAFLGVAVSGYGPDVSTLERAEKFLVRVMETDTDVAARRQAILSLALKTRISAATAERVVAHYESSDNLWETFPVQQFFEYHAAEVRALRNYAELRQRLGAVNSLYTAAILNSLDN
jgi:hypothetical protein